MSASPANWRRLVTIGGTLLLFLSLYFIFERLWEQRDKLQDWHPEPVTGYVVLAGILVYALSDLFLSANWDSLLRLFGRGPLHPAAARSVYARSQIAKYIPGNVLHIAGRHVMGRDLGIAHATLAMAALYEILGLLAAAASLALLGAGLFGLGQGELGGVQALLLLLAGVGAVFFAGHRIAPLVIKRYAGALTVAEDRPGRALFGVYVRYLGFFLLAGGILWALVIAFQGLPDLAGTALVLITFALSWTLGFITPGAPSGIGIREAVIVLALERLLPSPDALIIAILFRVVTVLGDVLFVLLAVAMARGKVRAAGK